MLKFFRDQKNGWLMKGILTLTALSFVSLFGTSRFLDKIPDESKAVAKVAGEKITVAQFVKEMEQKVRALGKLAHKPVTMKDAAQSGILPVLFTQMVSRSAMLAAVDRLDLTVSDEAVRETIAHMPAFAGSDGSFSMTAFKEHLKDTGISEKRFVEDTFLDLRYAQMSGAAEAATVIPADNAELFFRMQNEKRTADVFTIKPDALKIEKTLSEEDRERLYKELSEDLISPEYRTFTVLSLTLDDVSKRIKLTEAELLEAYNENKDAYAAEEIRDVDQMLFSTEEEAVKAYAALKQGQDFMTVAEQYAHQTEDQTKLGDLTPSTATSEWADAVFSVQKGGIVAPVQTSFGWQILRVNEITPKVEKSFQEIRDEIEQKLIASMAFDTLMDTAIALDDRFGAGETIEEVAASTGYPVKKYVLSDSTGVDENGKEVKVSKNILAAAFAVEAGRETPMTEDGTDFFVLRVDDVKEPALKPIEKAGKEIKEAWIAEQQKAKAKEIAKKIEADLKKGVALKTIAKTTGADYKKVEGITRHGEQLPASVTYQVFNRPLKEIVTIPAQGEYFVFRTLNSEPADPAKERSKLARLRRSLKEQTAQDKADAFLSDFSAYLGLQVKEDTLQKAISYLTKASQEDADE